MAAASRARRRVVGCLALLVAVATLTVACHPASDYRHDCPPAGTVRKYLIDRVNDYRSQKGLGRLYCNAFAQAKGQDHADAMNAYNTGYHTTLENGYPSGYWCWVGENWGMSAYPDPQQADNNIAQLIFDAWIASYEHRKIIVEDAAEWIGIGVTKEPGDDMWASLQMGTPHDSVLCKNAG